MAVLENRKANSNKRWKTLILITYVFFLLDKLCAIWLVTKLSKLNSISTTFLHSLGISH